MKNIYKKYTTPVLYLPEDGLEYWREKLLLSFLFFSVITAGIAYFPSIYFAVKSDLITIAVFDTVIYLAFIVLLFSRELSVVVRSLSIIILAYLLGVFLLIEVGPFGAGYLWLFISPIIASVLLDFKYVVSFIVLNIITLVVLGFLQSNNLIANGHEYGFNYEMWIIISVNFIFINIATVASIILIVRGLEKSFHDQMKVTHTLEKQKEELVLAKETAENSVKLKSEFLAQISHEIRTPLNTILSFISLIKGELSGKHSEDIDESFGMIENGSKRIIRTIDLILNMSEVQTKSIEVNKKKIKLIETILLPVFNEFYQIAIDKGLSFNCNNNMEDDVVVFADSYTVMQMFANLIDNAIKYTKEGTITISCKYNDVDNIVVEVEDSGIGISEDFMKELYQPFTQEESGYTRKYDGIGLGLSLVKSYCDINNLKLSVKSQKNVGTTFGIEFKPCQKS